MDEEEKISTQNFVRDAAINNQFEILASQLALQESQDDSVKQFAQRIVDDHTRIGNELKKLASLAENNIPPPPAMLDAKHQRMLDALSSADDFDMEYVDMQVDAHDATVALFESYASEGDNDALKRFASNTLPTLQEHQEMVGELKALLSEL